MSRHSQDSLGNGGAPHDYDNVDFAMTKLPPGLSGKMAAKDDHHRRKPVRRRSHNTMETTALSPKYQLKRRKNMQSQKVDEFSDLPTETMKRIDYVIVREKEKVDEAKSKDSKKLQTRLQRQKKFEMAMQQEEVEVQEEGIGDNVLMKLHVPFKRLCQEAERIKLEMPLEGVRKYSFIMIYNFIYV